MEVKKIFFHISRGMYSCKWKSNNKNAGLTPIGEKLWWWFVLLVFLFAVCGLFFWSVFSNDYGSFDWFIYDKSGILFTFGIFILSVLTIVVFYLLLLCVAGIATQKQDGRLHLCHKIFLFFVSLLPVLLFVLVQLLWEEEYGTALLAWHMLGPFIHIVILISYTVFSFFIFKNLMELQNQSLFLICSVIYWCIMVFICLLPLTIHSPCIHPRLDNISKPLLLGHRGGYTRRAPENTIMSISSANGSCDVFGIESDVRLSRDGVPFLMHDRTLLRTTDVDDVFPNRSSDRPENFYWHELQTLDAGSWFLEQDPYQTVRFLSSEEKVKITRQRIPSLRDLILSAKENNYSLMFDLYQPPKNHSNYQDFWNVTLRALFDSGLDQKLVLWLPVKNKVLETIAPGFRLVSAVKPIEQLLKNRIELVNVPYQSQSKEKVENYKRNNISVIQYIISTPWIFSAVWCQDTDVVTTGNCKSLSTMNSPIYTLSPSEYLAIWLCCDLVCLVISASLFFYLYKQVYSAKSVLKMDGNEPTSSGYINQS